MDGIERHDDGHQDEHRGDHPDDHPDEHPERWAGDESLIERFSGDVGEVQDPLTWGLDLEDEAITGLADEHDPTCERFVRAYRCFTGEALEVETIRSAVSDDDVEDVVRAACSGALAAPLHADIAAPVDTVDIVDTAAPAERADPDPVVPNLGDMNPADSPSADTSADTSSGAPDFADAFGDYRSAMRALVAEVDAAPLVAGTFAVDGEDGPSVQVEVRGTCAVYVVAAGRALVVTGPSELVDRVDVVTHPVVELLTRHGRHRAPSADGEAPPEGAR